MKAKTIFWKGLWAVIVVVAVWHFTGTFLRAGWSWSLAVFFGASFVLLFFFLMRKRKPAPNQLVLKMTEGDKKDDRTFKVLHERFKKSFPKSSSIRFDGFDATDELVWFYFQGKSDPSVYDLIMAQTHGCTIRKGSYFVSNAKSDCASFEGASAVELCESVPASA
jgi:hypothetical protein